MISRHYRVHFEPMDVISESPEKIAVTFLRPEIAKIVIINEEGFEIK